jgi:pyruvate/2-oxoglutarate/acetoin dehydrogenase E1 component
MGMHATIHNNFENYEGLLKAAVHDEGPVLFLKVKVCT